MCAVKMGLCAWRDKNAYFTSSEKETRVQMLQKYLDRTNVPRPTEAPDSSCEQSENSVQETDRPERAQDTGQTPEESSSDQRREETDQSVQQTPRPLEDASDLAAPVLTGPSMDTPSSTPVEWDSALASPPEAAQDGVSPRRLGTSQQAAAFVFLRYP